MRDELKKYQNNKAKLEAEKAKLLKQMNNNRAARNKKEANNQIVEDNLDDENINDLLNNIKENVNNYSNLNNKNNIDNLEPEQNTGANETKQNMERARELLSNISITDLESFAKKQGINV